MFYRHGLHSYFAETIPQNSQSQNPSGGKAILDYESTKKQKTVSIQATGKLTLFFPNIIFV
jgi:hypothetical protein